MEACEPKKNLGLARCAKLPGMIKGMITTPESFKATEVEAVDPDFWQDALLAPSGTRIYLWPDFVNMTDNSEQAVYENTPLAVMAVRDGRYNFRFEIKENLCLHKAMFTHRAISGRVFFIDVENQIIGTLDSDGNLIGFSIMLLNTEKMMISNGTVSTKSPVTIVLRDNLELDRDGALVDAPFINTLARLTDVTLTIVGSPTASSLVVDVKATCDDTPVNGLVLADFVLTKNDGMAQTTPPASSVEVNGRYTISKVGGTAWVDGFLNLVSATALSVEGYESTGPVVVDIP